jgi:hypothetical protein
MESPEVTIPVEKCKRTFGKKPGRKRCSHHRETKFSAF